MGKLIYGQGRREVEIEDRTLAHLKAVILIKLRRGESFAMSWPHGLDSGSGRSTIWMNPTIPVEFVFSGNRVATPNRMWIELLLRSANAPEGLQMIPEPEPAATTGPNEILHGHEPARPK